VAVAPLV